MAEHQQLRYIQKKNYDSYSDLTKVVKSEFCKQNKIKLGKILALLSFVILKFFNQVKKYRSDIANQCQNR